MQQLLDWTLETIRSEPSDFSWMEEYRYEWTPLVSNALKQIAQGKTALIVTDDERDWFGHYLVNNLNNKKHQRTFLPFYRLKNLFPQLGQLNPAQDFELLEDLLDISFPNGYFIWYVGNGDNGNTAFSYRFDNSFLWVYDEDVADGFSLKSVDKMRDIKLIQLYNLFERTLTETLFGEISLD